MTDRREEMRTLDFCANPQSPLQFTRAIFDVNQSDGKNARNYGIFASSLGPPSHGFQEILAPEVGTGEPEAKSPSEVEP
jgi:hypothetical protein